MSDSVQPQRQQPTRLPCPWDSPGKSTGVGCHCLLPGTMDWFQIGKGVCQGCILSHCLFNLYAEYIWRRQWHPTPALLPGKSHGWRSLVGCSPWGHKESDTTERLHFHFSLSCIGEGNGNPLQCSCLESPRNGGAWWAAVYGVAQSRT